MIDVDHHPLLGEPPRSPERAPLKATPPTSRASHLLIKHTMAQEWLNSSNYGTIFAGLQIVAFLGSMRWFVSLRKRYDEETVKGWLVPHTGIKGVPGVVGTGVAWCVISSLVYIVSPFLSLEQDSYKSLSPTGGKDYFIFVFAFVQFAFLCSLYQRRSSDWLPRLLLLLLIWVTMYAMYAKQMLNEPVFSGTSFLVANTLSLFAVKTFFALWTGQKAKSS